MSDAGDRKTQKDRAKCTFVKQDFEAENWHVTYETA